MQKNERVRLQSQEPLLAETLELYDRQLEKTLTSLKSKNLSSSELSEEIGFYQSDHEKKIEELKTIFSRARDTPRPPPVPDYLLDPISFNIFTDPVISPSGQTYERSWILEHLRKNKTDPFSRKAMTEKDLIPNLAVRQAAEDFIKTYGITN